MKNAFSLIEILISIVLFSLVLVFLYQTLDLSKSSNNFYEKKLENKFHQERLKKVFYEDIAHAKKVEILHDRFGHTILKLETDNLYHNIFYKYVTYIVSREKNLFRIESVASFNERELLSSFFNKAYVDKLGDNSEIFKVSQSKDNTNIYSIVYKEEKSPLLFFNALRVIR